jgi:glyoxylase-like metal-dependent hydrolase (beta-lactamase superfamily II)
MAADQLGGHRRSMNQPVTMDGRMTLSLDGDPLGGHSELPLQVPLRGPPRDPTPLRPARFRPSPRGRSPVLSRLAAVWIIRFPHAKRRNRAERTTASVGGVADYKLLSAGYLRDEDDHVGSSVSFVKDADAVIVIDPGMVADRKLCILDPLAALGVGAEDVTDVVISHHHPDHTLNVALFPMARVHDHWAWYRDDLWTSRDAEGFQISDDVELMGTPGHTPQDISTCIRTDDGLIVCTHLWWSEGGPPEDPYAIDPNALHENRRRILAQDNLSLIVPGHGPPFRPDSATSR